MSITDELRNWAEGNALCAGMSLRTARDQALAIADRIDAEHERLMAERRRSCVFYDAERNYCKVHDEGDMAELGYVRLPVDADGVPIRVGDVMEWIDLDGEVTVTCSVDAVGVDCFFAWDKGNRRYAQKCANAYRHHHASTVEDVLREFARECLTYATCVDDHEVQDAIEMYAAKLRLAGDAE